MIDDVIDRYGVDITGQIQEARTHDFGLSADAGIQLDDPYAAE